MDEKKRWTVIIDIEYVGGAVRAVARLHDRMSDRLVAEGVALLGPVERAAPDIGPEVAAARALHQLSARLVAAAMSEYEHSLAHEPRPGEIPARV